MSRMKTPRRMTKSRSKSGATGAAIIGARGPWGRRRLLLAALGALRCGGRLRGGGLLGAREGLLGTRGALGEAFLQRLHQVDDAPLRRLRRQGDDLLALDLG